MPISDLQFEDGIFFAREVGQIDRESADLWSDTLERHASESASPIIALVDATEIGFVASAARLKFLRANEIPNVKAVIIVLDDPVHTQSARALSMLGTHDRIHIVASVDDGWQLARDLISETP